MNREQAIEIAREYAKAKPESYYAEPFQPHEWVIDAITSAYELGFLIGSDAGYDNGHRDASQER